jgi:hypothetical protein
MARYGTAYEAEILCEFARKSTKSIIEIGVLDGETSALIASAASVPVFGIDPIIPDSMNASLIGHEQQIKANTEPYKNFTFIKDYSYNVAKYWNAPIDMIFIDGNHEYDACKADIETWWSLVDGIMLIHDSAPIKEFSGHPGPIRLVKEMIEAGKQYIGTWDTITGFRTR